MKKFSEITIKAEVRLLSSEESAIAWASKILSHPCIHQSTHANSGAAYLNM
jgi:hypothetical protein